VEVIVKLLFGSIAPSFAFLISSTGIQFQEKPFLRGRGQKHWGNGENSDFRLKLPRVAVAA